MAEIVYFLCAVTSLACAFLLLSRYRRTRARLLLWSCTCFVGLAISNAVLVFDLVLFPQLDLSLGRALPAGIGLALLVYGLVWET